MTAATFAVVAASGGVATGRAVVLQRSSKPGGDKGCSSSTVTVDDAFDRVAEEFNNLADRLRAGGHAEVADIVAADRHAAAIEALQDRYLAERAADVRQAGRRAAAVIDGESAPHLAGDGPVVLVGDELGPAEMPAMETVGVVAGVSVRGGANSHAAIVARSLGMPFVIGADPAVLGVDDGTVLVVGADRALVIVDPSVEQTAHARQSMASAARRSRELAGLRGLPCETTDGHRIGLLCNVAIAPEILAGLEAGAEGVGLLRTELPFRHTARWPDEAAHRAALKPVLGLLAGRPVTVRCSTSAATRSHPSRPA